jgi:hypothetical protein
VADSYRLSVLKALTDHLKGITPANGYDYDLSAAVFRGRTVFGANDPIPLVSILEAPRSDAGRFAGDDGYQRSEDWSLMVQGWAADDIANPTDPLYGLMDAVEHRMARLIATDVNSGFAVYPNEYMLGRKVGSIAVLPGVVRPPMAEVSAKAFFYLPIRVGLARPSE